MIYLLVDKALHDEYTCYLLTQHFTQYESLFKGTDDEHLIEVEPVLFAIDANWKEKIAAEKYIRLNTYLLLESGEKITDLRIHLQQFIYQKINGKLFYFRIWDGAVLEKFLPTCTLEQLRLLYKNIESITYEDNVQHKQVFFLIDNGKVKLVESDLEEKVETPDAKELLPNEPKTEEPSVKKGKTRNWNM